MAAAGGAGCMEAQGWLGMAGLAGRAFGWLGWLGWVGWLAAGLAAGLDEDNQCLHIICGR